MKTDKPLFILALLAGFEPATYGLEVLSSQNTQLTITKNNNKIKSM